MGRRLRRNRPSPFRTHCHRQGQTLLRRRPSAVWEEAGGCRGGGCRQCRVLSPSRVSFGQAFARGRARPVRRSPGRAACFAVPHLFGVFRGSNLALPGWRLPWQRPKRGLSLPRDLLSAFGPRQGDGAVMNPPASDRFCRSPRHSLFLTLTFTLRSQTPFRSITRGASSLVSSRRLVSSLAIARSWRVVGGFKNCQPKPVTPSRRSLEKYDKFSRGKIRTPKTQKKTFHGMHPRFRARR